MDYLERMRHAKETRTEALIQFLQNYDGQSHKVYCFVEASIDKNFYSNCVRRILPFVEVFCYVCKNKSGVLKIRDTIRGRKDLVDKKFGFFVDRDFDSSCGVTEVYETPCYSLENWFVDRQTFKNILHDLFGLPYTSTELSQYQESYDRLLEEFNRKVELFNCWFYAHAVKRQTEQVETVLNVKTKLDGVVKVKTLVNNDLLSIADLKMLKSKSEVETLFNNRDIDDVAFAKAKETLSRKNKTEMFYGKLQLKFFISFLMKFRDFIGTANGTTMARRKTKLAFSYDVDHMMIALQSFVPIPTELRDYILSLGPSN